MRFLRGPRLAQPATHSHAHTDNIIGEIAHLHRPYGIRGFMLYDDELNVNPKMVELMIAMAGLAELCHVFDPREPETLVGLLRDIGALDDPDRARRRRRARARGTCW